MVTRIRTGARIHLYIEEWMEHRGLNDSRMGERIGVDRATVHRWRNEQHRLNPSKIAKLADALDIDSTDLYRLPARPSIDAIVEGAPEEVQSMVVDIARRMTGKG